MCLQKVTYLSFCNNEEPQWIIIYVDTVIKSMSLQWQIASWEQEGNVQCVCFMWGVDNLSGTAFWSCPGGSVVKNLPTKCRRHKRCLFNPWIRKIPWKSERQPTPVFLPRESHGQRSLAGYSPWGCKESDTTEHTLAIRRLRLLQMPGAMFHPWSGK